MTTAQRIIDSISYATVATASKLGEPWNTPVFCAHDGFTLYWSSHRDSVHSQNIAATGQAFIVIYNSKAGEGEKVGLYIKAKVNVLDDEQHIRRALDLLGARRGKPFRHTEKFMGNGPQRIYMAEPIELWINDGDFIRDYRVPASVA